MGTQYKAICTHAVKPITAIAQGRAVQADGAQVSVSGATFIGIAETNGTAGGAYCNIVISGTATAEAASAFPLNALLVADATGRFVVAQTLNITAGGVAVTSTAANGGVIAGGAAAQYVGAIALEASSGAGDMVEVKLL